MINMIVAYSKNRGIGVCNKLPWHIPKDLERFKWLTIGNGHNAVIMGRRTYESLPTKLLSLRKNIVVSNTLSREKNPHLIIKRNLFDALEFCEYTKRNESWIIGGSQIYDLALKEHNVNNILVTEIDKDFTCDTFIDEFPDNFKLIHTGRWKKTEYLRYRYLHYKNQDLTLNRSPHSYGN